MPRKIPTVLRLPQFEATAEQILETGRRILADSKVRVEQMSASTSPTYESLLGALDELEFAESDEMDRIYLLQNVSPDESIRKAAQETFLKFQEWQVEKAYHPGLYQAFKRYADSKPALEGEQKKYLDDVMTDYRRLGLHLPEATQTELKSLQKKLSQLETQFSTNINDFDDGIWVKPSELGGLDKSFIEGLQKNAQGEVRISLQYPEYLPVMEFCQTESVRRALSFKKYNAARETNIPLLNEMIELRDRMAKLLGYPSYNHYVIEDRMAKKPERVRDFLTHFEKRLRIKAQAEIQALEKLKAEQTGEPQAKIHIWDYSYYTALYKKLHYEVDLNQLKDFFPLSHVLDGLFDVFGELFGLRFERQAAGSFQAWHSDVQLIIAKDARDNSVVGAFYLDLFPRPGKYNHAAAFGLRPGKALKDGTYSAPIGCMVCNFPKTEPCLLPHSDVETLFHEFGHVLHNLMTTAKITRFSGTSVAWDFVEAPSQVLENWCWDHKILSRISKHTKDPSRQISEDFVKKMNEAQKAGVGLFYLRQVAFAKADLEFHAEGARKDSTAIMNRNLTETFFPPPENSAFQAAWGHMVGYASGYYGYAWADVMAADIFSFFKKTNLMSPELGMKLRTEIYEPGSSRDENLSLEGFLGRPLSDAAFFENLGI